MDWLIWTFLLASIMATDNRGFNHPEPYHYTLNPFHTQKLVLLEEELAHVLATLENEMFPLIMDDRNPCTKMISQFLDEFNEDGEAIRGHSGNRAAEIISENPILIFKMIRRIFVTIMRDLLPTCKKDVVYGPENVTELVNSVFQKHGLTYPTEEDWHDASLGILRIQYIYGYNATSHFRLGIFKGVKTNAYFNLYDCLALTDKAIDLKAMELAYQWIESAKLALKEKKYSSTLLLHDIRFAMNVYQTRLQNFADVKTAQDLDIKLQGKRQERLDGFLNFEKYAACRNKNKEQGLTCFYTRGTARFVLSPIKTEWISENPPVLRFYNFVESDLASYLKSVVLRNLTRCKQDLVLDHPIEESMDKCTFMVPTYENLDDLDLLKKKIYNNFVNSGYKHYARKLLSQTSVRIYGALGGYQDFYSNLVNDRLEQIIIFMSDAKVGGNIIVNDIIIEPIAGSVVLMSINPNQFDQAECPVVLGNSQVVKLSNI